jgi:8-oxo-dGTP diphosphatase
MEPVRRAFSVAIFCRHQGHILLVRHRRLGTWLPVGGEVEPGETPLEAARRELREETGLEGTFPAGLGVEGTPPGLIGYEEHLAGKKGLHMNFAFVADVPSRHLAECDEYDDVVWVTDASAVDCPRNVRELVILAVAAPSSALA